MTYYKTKYKRLKKEYDKIKVENMLMRSLNKPTASQKIEILVDYYNWTVENEYDANSVQAYFLYIKKLKKSEKE